jgi:hypothetical protein
LKSLHLAQALGCGACWLLAVPAEARFLQVDPVGYQDYINLYIYTGNDPLNRHDPTGKRDIYIGGGGDTMTEIVKSYANDQMRAHPGRDIQYFIWSNTSGIQNAVGGTPQNEPLNIIGHSLGAAEAMRQDPVLRPADNLITIDPVDLPGNAIDAPTANNIDAKNWINVTANPSSPNASDGVAALGGKVSPERTSGADSQVSSSANHGDFGPMMRGSGAQQDVDRTYCNRSGEKPC